MTAGAMASDTRWTTNVGTQKVVRSSGRVKTARNDNWSKKYEPILFNERQIKKRIKEPSFTFEWIGKLVLEIVSVGQISSWICK